MSKLLKVLRKGKSGFTLIELLVVIAIIGLLATILLASLNQARQKGRDARRIGDIQSIKVAMELYYDAHQDYPATTSGTFNTPAVLQTEGFLSQMPTDPAGNTQYHYERCSATAYILAASLEQPNAVHSNDLTADPTGCSATWPANSTAGVMCAGVGTDAGSKCYATGA